ncbi:SDR family NAD(P)-dependent oxidoreductase [Gordonia sp. C13]|uniref:SDR family NAD(P)-dependent oxidoreductase n=1 Tax=Gordonia sp. C13 TaxID=2935078 RepID=UPI00200B9DB4|nr:SDR family NAD(P)-dependent oxidoreductase [Gordonia sp. C13]MCK8615521.1 SDR family oxidoreductase [Gordonia sp. C13]
MAISIDLQGQSAVVTGGSRGIGRAVALTLAAAGAHVTILDRTDHAKPDSESTSGAIRARGGTATSKPVDIAVSAEVDDAIAHVADERGIDILVNNAGTIIAGSATETTDSMWRELFAINVDGTFYCSRAALRYMEKQGSGKIVNVTSVSGSRGNAGFAAYCAAKGALNNLTRQLGVDYAARGINVNAVAPGFTETEMTAMYDQDIRRALESQTPNGRWAEAQHIADAALLLASPMASHMCGEIITVDGGWSVGTPVTM